MLELRLVRGFLGLFGPELDRHIQRLAPGTHVDFPHITVLTKAEVQKLDPDAISLPISQDSLQILSVGNFQDVEFLTASWAHAQMYRKKLGLEPKAFHITLSKIDNHEMSRDFTTTKGGYPSFRKIFRELPETAMNYILADLLTTPWQQELCFEFLDKFPTSYRAMIRVADSTQDRPHAATNAYARALSLNPALHDYVLKRLRKLGPLAPCGPFQIEGTEPLPASVLFPWPQEAKDAVRNIISEHPTETRGHINYISSPPFPRFFSMPIPYRIAAMSTPRNEQDIDLLSKIGITKVLTLTEEPLDASWFQFKKLSNIFVPVMDYNAPTIAEMDYIYTLFTSDTHGFWLIHCGGGKGRAGTVLACLLAMHGNEDGKPQMETGLVISLLRKMRPGSIETMEQETFIGAWISHRWKTAHTSARIEEPYSDLVREFNPKAFPTGITSGDVKCIMLVGLPGSGKSWVVEAIALRRSGQTIIISQDESGSRSACETQMGGKYKDDTLVILDRCNPEASDRKYWLSLLRSNSNTLCLYFDYSPDLCLQRIDARLNHPTIQAGRGRNAIKQMYEKMQVPSPSEGFGAVLTVSSHDAAREAIFLLGGKVDIIKFPRTVHLINLGATTDDDIVQDYWKDDLVGQLVIEEKIDGANMGFSLDFDKNVLVQNRSHYVNYTTHAQFRPLKIWLERNGGTIKRLLDLDPKFPERYILYGEWVAATHSIPYSSLPDYFIAFDFYDRVTCTFVSREYISRMLDGTGIQQVPLIKSTDRISREELLQLVRGESVWYQGPVEGVYIRFEDEKRAITKERGKIVRSDFLAGNEHWTKAQTMMNGLSLWEGEGEGEGEE